jgi:hypothetical protein
MYDSVMYNFIIVVTIFYHEACIIVTGILSSSQLTHLVRCQTGELVVHLDPYHNAYMLNVEEWNDENIMRKLTVLIMILIDDRGY